ncbi:helix-turn-helix transcriptional regulator [Aureimonas fodinaquatilis]|uniref:Helix-turn-helix transcriptional regulator n=1 Tax=Aureimonas fodinaquatilis TaxID=2565783 RepID=A0A5B0DY74_9HYPH|nr:helix-turn-helix transcriptional regulator [Aureimonas fodinaquatilis]KAA0970701.1 helix-turn-helix transcriptional regulator [Aureimonas fodinaquatilis]
MSLRSHPIEDRCREKKSVAGSQDLAEDLIAAVYAALLGETSWQSFLEKLNGTYPGALSTLFFHNRRSHKGAITYVAGVEGRTGALAQYESYYANLNPWMKKVELTPVGMGIVGEQIIARNHFNRSEYYSDYLHRNGLETGTGVTVFKDEDCYFLLSTLTDDTNDDRNIERAALLTRIAPHLQRAFNYYRSGDLRSAAVNLGQDIADSANLALVVINENFKPVKISPTAQQMLATGNPAGITPVGRLRFRDSVLQSALQVLLQRGSLNTRTCSFNSGGRNIRLIRIGAGTAADYFAGPMVAMLIENEPVPLLPANVQHVAATYSLTSAETRVFAAIAAGSSVSTIARDAGLSRETVRSQLKAIFSKVGIHSQKDLVRVAAGIRTTF